MAKAVPKSRIGAIGIALLIIASFEGLRTVDYWDGYGRVSTACFGHTQTAKVGVNRTVESCEDLLFFDVRKFQNIVLSHVKVSLTNNQLAALTSFVYNVGEGNFKKSTLLRRINSGEDIAKVCQEELPRWVKAGGTTLKGLEKRRKEEAALCSSPDLVVN